MRLNLLKKYFIIVDLPLNALIRTKQSCFNVEFGIADLEKLNGLVEERSPERIARH